MDEIDPDLDPLREDPRFKAMIVAETRLAGECRWLRTGVVIRRGCQGDGRGRHQGGSTGSTAQSGSRRPRLCKNV